MWKTLDKNPKGAVGSAWYVVFAQGAGGPRFDSHEPHFLLTIFLFLFANWFKQQAIFTNQTFTEKL